MSSKILKYALRLGTAFIILLSCIVIAWGQKYTGSPVTKDRLVRAVKSKQFAVPTIVKQIQASGVDFEVTPTVEGELHAVATNQQIIEACRNNYRYAASRGGTHGPPPPQPVRDVAGEKYESLFYQGVEQLGTLRTATSVAQALEITKSAKSLGLQAISTVPSRPEAYALVASSFLWERNWTESERYAQMSIDRGGDLTFPVVHLQPSPHLDVLHIGRGFVTVESTQEFYQFNGSEISNPSAQQDYVYMQTRVAVFSFSTYKNGAGYIWYLAPANTGTHEEAAMIMRLIQRDSMSGR